MATKRQRICCARQAAEQTAPSLRICSKIPPIRVYLNQSMRCLPKPQQICEKFRRFAESWRNLPKRGAVAELVCNHVQRSSFFDDQSSRRAKAHGFCRLLQKFAGRPNRGIFDSRIPNSDRAHGSFHKPARPPQGAWSSVQIERKSPIPKTDYRLLITSPQNPATLSPPL